MYDFLTTYPFILLCVIAGFLLVCFIVFQIATSPKLGDNYHVERTEETEEEINIRITLFAQKEDRP